VGSYGVGGLAALIAAALALGLRRRGTWLLMLSLLGSGALLRGMDWTQPVGAPFRVSLLQGNVPQSLKWVPERLPLSIETYTGLAQAHPAALSVLPETALPLFFHEVPREVLQALTQHGDVLVGTAVRLREGGYVNGAVAVSPVPQGFPSVTPTFSVQSYAKQHLVPFGEYVPPGFAWFFGLVNIPLSDFSAGPPRQAPITLAGQPGVNIAPNICYEDLFGEELAASFQSPGTAPTVLVNLSNLAWFDDSVAIDQHLQISRLRALELRRPMLRSTNTGATAVINHRGEVTHQLPRLTRGRLEAVVEGRSGSTPFARWAGRGGLWPVWVACLTVVALLASRRPRRRRTRGPGMAPPPNAGAP
jgi:apolipoprotein N-acyltransferase